MMLSAFWPFYQFIWTIFFFTMFLVGFWCIFMFFGLVIPMWLTEGLKEYFGKVKSFDPEQIRRKNIYEQEGVEVIYNEPKGNGPFLHDSHGHHH
ncbi:hypothetical protein [Chryseobacterium defluvii]|uniref:Uncharacterized protein n=1 Tax=Chryseobacterium defluvii TaxID=160396 RepID=A0A495SA27_9FLAO|nr:hypothetical protein [Chryseobacterium defluvii]RKS96757.1 hypothetical protein BCF58_3191 [Chryseobacterium defluvii]